jgi:hypothetical protein
MKIRQLMPQNTRALLIALAFTLSPQVSHAGIILEISRTMLQSDLGANATVETFGSLPIHFPIPSGVLSSQTNEAGITPGSIQPGVTYSIDVGSGAFFGTDSGAGFPDAPFLVVTQGGTLTVKFDQAVRGFGFDTNHGMGNLATVHIRTVGGGDQPFTVPVPVDQDVVGIAFEDSSDDITGATIVGNGTDGASVAIDNFTFGSTADIPEPSTLALASVGLFGFAFGGPCERALRRREFLRTGLFRGGRQPLVRSMPI